MAINTFEITDHAWERLLERAYLEPILQDQLRHGIPYGMQRGTSSELLLLPCSLVAVVQRDGHKRVCVTLLTAEQATANMQAFAGAANIPPPESAEPKSRVAQWVPASTRSRLADMAHQHVIERAGKKRRNQLLRESGFDPEGEEGRIYRELYNEAWTLEAKVKARQQSERVGGAVK